MTTLLINGCRPARPSFIFLRQRPTLEPTGAIDWGPVGGGLPAHQPEPATYLDRQALTAAALAVTTGGVRP